MSACRSCRAEVWWARTQAGKRMPVDPDPVPEGNVVVVHPGSFEDSTPIVAALGAAALSELAPGVPRYTSHFATCPHADSHRRRT